MADTNPSLDIPPTKKLRLDSTASEGSEVLSQFLNDLENLPDLSSLDGLAANDTSGLINNTASASNSLPQQQNTLPAPNASVAGSLTPTPNHQGSNVSPSATPPITSQVSSGPTPYSASPSLSQTPLSNATPNATINMYANSPRGGDVNSSLYPGFNATGNAPSPQPMAVSTLADPTPVLPSVSSTPARGTASIAPSSSMQNFDPTMSRTSFQSPSSAPMMSSSVGASSMPQQSSMMSNMRGGAPMPPNMRMGMNAAYQTGQGMHPGMHGMQSHPGQMGQQSRMMGPMRVGMATPSHVMSMDGQMGRPGMVNQMGPQGMHPQMRTQFHNYGPHSMNTAVQQPQMGPRMVPSHMGMSHMRQINPGMNPAAMGRPGMPMTHNMAPGGQQTMSMRMPNPGMVQNRPVGGVNMYNPAGQTQVQADNRFTGTPEQAPQMQQSMTNSAMGQPPAPPSSNQAPQGGSQGGPGAPSVAAHQNDTTFGGQQQGASQNSGVVGNTASQAPQARPPQQQGPPNTALGSTGGNPSLPINSNLSSNVEESSMPSAQNPSAQQQQQQQQPSVASSQPQAGMNQPMSSRVPTPPPPGASSMGFLSGAGNKMQGAPQNQTSDPEKRKQIQQQLVLLLHAHKCQRRERDQQATGDYRPCTLPHCKTMKSVLNHMTECQAGRSCTYAHCATSRQIINHWRNCVRPDCPVCLPLKHPTPHSQKQPTGQPADVPGMMQSVSGLGTVSGIGSNAPPDLGQNTGFGHNPRMGMGQNPSGMGPTPSGMAPGGSMMNVPRPNAGPSHMMPTGGGMVDPNRTGMFQARDMIGPGGYPNPGAVPGISNTPSTFPLPIPPIMSNPTQAWHSLVNPDLRQHLVRKLVEAIYPVHDPTALRDARVKSLIQYAMKVEKVMFEAAQSREEYYKLLAQKIYLIRKELEDRKRNKNRVGGQIPPMMNGGDPTHQGYPGQPPSVPSNSSQYPLPPTPNSMNALSVTGNPSPHPNSDLSTGFPPTPIQSIDTKKEPNKMLSPTGIPMSSSSDPSAQLGSVPSIPGSVKTEIKNELLSPTFPPGSIAGTPQSHQQQIKTELNTAGMDSVGNIAGVPPLPDNIPSVPTAPTPVATGVPSVKAPESIKRRESISSEMPPSSAKPATPSIPMDTSTPRSPAVSGRIQSDPALRKVFTPDELETALRPVFDAVWNQDVESFPFQQPVDPIRLGIPDYFEVIKKPMDLTTISNKLSDGVYKSGWEFCADMWLMFDNAWLYNKKTSRVYKFCTKLSEVFDQHINAAMIQLGYCCGMRYTYHPQVLYCYGKPLCTIPRDSPYYGCQNRYIYCPKCFNEIQGDTVTVGDDPLSATRIPKSQFKELRNNAIDKEPFVECVHCGREMHQICVLHHDQIWPGGFQCDSCLSALGKRKKDNKFVPRRLPVTKLGSYLEERVNRILISDNSGAGHVTIRVVSSSDKTLDTRPLMRDRFAGDFPPQFPYRTKAMFVFEEIDGVDVCFFGMHVQEYGSDCQAPNTRRVYISYLDSVHFFKPRLYRTKVYHEILIGYLDFCKANGFMTAHIWACPPSEGDDYIFHCHPPEQKIPKPKRLSDWYRKMLDTAKEMGVIYDYRDIFKFCTDEGVTIVTELPYFEGDFWPNVLEEFIKELDQEAREREASEFASSDSGPKKAGKRSTNKKGGSKKASGARNKSTKKGGALIGGDDLSSKVYQTMEKHKDVFFTVLLQPPVSDASPMSGTVDPDQLITCDLMDGRDAFLTMSRERHWEFSSLRRAKFSSIAMVYELHTQSEDKFMYNCNSCHLDVVARYHCTECDDFDLCIKCYKEVGHKHQMVKLGLDIDDPQSNEAKQLDPQKARQASIEKCIRALVHATQCRDPHCKQPSCIKMKKVLTHTKECKLMLARKWNQCTICKQFVLLCISHAKNCSEDTCRVPLCTTIKKNLKEQRKQRAQDTNRFAQLRAARMTSMLTSNTGNGATTSGTGSSPQQSSSTHVSPQNSAGKNPNPAVPSPGPGPRSVGKGPKTPGTPGGKGRMASVATPPVGMGANPGSALVQAGKPEQNMPSVPPNVTVSSASASPLTPGEFRIQKVAAGPTPEQLLGMLQDPNRKDAATQYLNNNQELKQRVILLMRNSGTPQNMMPFHPNPMGGNTPMYNQQHHLRPPGSMQYTSNYGHPQQAMMRYSPNHSQYPMSHQVNQQRMPPSNYPARSPYQNTQQNPSTLQRMLTSGTPQQFATQQPSYNPQMNPHHLGPPPQYPAAMRQQPMPQTAGYPQVLGQQNRPVPAPSPMGSHVPPQMSGQYSGGNQGMGMDSMGMGTDNSFMYQQGQPQFALNSSNNNNSYSQRDVLSALPPQDRLSKFVENL